MFFNISYCFAFTGFMPRFVTISTVTVLTIFIICLICIFTFGTFLSGRNIFRISGSSHFLCVSKLRKSASLHPFLLNLHVYQAMHLRFTLHSRLSLSGCTWCQGAEHFSITFHRNHVFGLDVSFEY